MKWTYKEPSQGDMVRVAIGSIYHFGIYVSDSEVIQFGLPPSRRGSLIDADVEVLASDIDEFLAGGFLEVCEFDRKERKKNRKPCEVVEYARSKIGTRGYHILYNNCEHFANECVTGTKICRQAEDLREALRKIPIVDVYISKIPNVPIGELDCKARMDEIFAVSNENVKREKYFVWKLLCYALERSFGMRGEKLDFRKESFGAWSVSNAEFSLSHSEGVLAVAVSRAAVGVDIEKLHAPRSEKTAERIMTVGELAEFASLSDENKAERFIEIWCSKEAVFKSRKLNAFVPSDIDTEKESFKTDSILIDGEKYIWSVASATPERIRLFTNIDLTKIN